MQRTPRTVMRALTRGGGRHRRLPWRLWILSLAVAVVAFLLTLMTRAAGAALQAGGPTIAVRLGSIITIDASETDHVEPWVAVDPRRPNRVIAAAIAQGSNSVVYASEDTGNTWVRGGIGAAASNTFAGIDPVVVFNGRGIAYFATSPPFHVWSSEDGGRVWNAPTVVPGRGYDRQFLAVRPGGPAGDTLFAVGRIEMTVFGPDVNGAIAVAQSADGGATFGFPRIFLPDPTRSIIHIPGGVVATSDGKVMISYMAHDRPVLDGALLRNHIWVMRSDDGGRRFADPVAVSPSVLHGNRSGRILAAKSASIAAIAMDTASSSPWRGRVAVSWLTRHEGRLQVMVATSSDTGRSWTEPVRVNDDSTGANHSTPVVAVHYGVIVVLWNDRRADPGDLCFRATVSASLDGGVTFLPNVAVPVAETCPLRTGSPLTERNRSFRERWLNGGETQGLVPIGAGAFLAVTVEEVRGALQLRAARIEVSGRFTGR